MTMYVATEIDINRGNSKTFRLCLGARASCPQPLKMRAGCPRSRGICNYLNCLNGKSSGDNGFTLIELIVVIVIIALVMGIGYPSLSRASSILNLQTAGRDVLNTFRYAREKAISEQTSMLLIISRSEGRFELANILGEPMRAYALPSGVSIQRMERAGNEVRDDVMTVRFAPNGNLENVGVRLASSGGSRRMQIISDPLSGGARVAPVWDD